MKQMRIATAVVFSAVFVLSAAAAGAAEFSAWGSPANVETLPGSASDVNTPYLDGCPIQAPNGLSLYMASTRPDGEGGIDIWVATRPSTNVGFGSPQNLGAPVNSPADDFCPTPLPGGRLFFVSSRGGGCGGADMYATKRTHSGAWRQPTNLGCQVNSAAGEASPSLVNEDGTSVLYFSSNRPGGFAAEAGTAPDSDIYRSTRQADGTFGAATLVPGVNTAAEDSRPNVRKDSLEMVFDSTRPGTLGGPDIYSAMRATVADEWTATHLASISSPASDTRASLSWDGLTLLFGSNRGGSELDPVTGQPSNDIYYSTRTAL
jgi:hypothetical protein